MTSNCVLCLDLAVVLAPAWQLYELFRHAHVCILSTVQSPMSVSVTKLSLTAEKKAARRFPPFQIFNFFIL